jgi:hypothetical protein
MELSCIGIEQPDDWYWKAKPEGINLWVKSMRLLTLYSGKWKIVAPLEVPDSSTVSSNDAQDCHCPLVRELQDYHAQKQYKAAVAGFIKLFELAVTQVNGPHALSKDWFHTVDSAEKIYEFVKGDLRLFCFVGDGALIICSSVSLKRRQKADPKEVAKAVRLKGQYLRAKESNNIMMVTGEKDALRTIR